MTTRADDALWAAVIAAEKELGRAHAAFYQQADLRRETLSRALRAGSKSWDSFAALDLLDRLSDDVPELLEELVDLAMVDVRALDARRVIARRRYVVTQTVRDIVARRLDTADDRDYWRLAELLEHLRDGEGLRSLVERARTSDDPDIREVADHFDQA